MTRLGAPESEPGEDTPRIVPSVSRWSATARAVVLVMALSLAVLGGLLYSGTPVEEIEPPTAELGADGQVRTDSKFYTAVVEHLRAGEPYYASMGAEMRAGNFPRKPVFTWRTPVHLSLLAALPSPWAWVGLLALVVLGASGMVTAAAHHRHGHRVATVVLLSTLLGLVPLISPVAALFPETWAGLLVLAALGAHLRGWWTFGAVLGVSALFYRELAAPWLVAMGVAALVERRWRTVATWAVGGILYAVYFGVHISRVGAHLIPQDDGWVQTWTSFGGAEFILSTQDFYAPVSVQPRLAAAVIVAALLTAVGYDDVNSRPIRWGLLVWLAFLLIFGQSFNNYWGCIGVGAVSAAVGLAVPVLIALVRPSANQR
ncbi:MAG: hypothetical protein JRJ84_13400, partial [Deltaproteobacteria bacterium]|nr:hypothetical protein [Deltaproteobacteria bacterium]